MFTQTRTYENAFHFFGSDYEKWDRGEKMGVNYSTFGAPMPGRNASSNQYRYGFNGMEKVDEMHNNSGDFYMADFRGFDARLGRWLSIDPIATPWESPYAGIANNPIHFADPKGLTAEGRGKNRDRLTRAERARAKEAGYSGRDIKRAENYQRKHGGELGLEQTAEGTSYNLVWGSSYDAENKIYNDKVTFGFNMKSDPVRTLGASTYQVTYTELHPSFSNIPSKGWVNPTQNTVGSIGTLSGVVENGLNGSTVGSNLKVYPSGWGGNQYVSTVKASTIGKVGGIATLGVGTVIDGIGVYNYYQEGPNSPNAVHPTKATVNFGVGVWSLYTGIPGAIGGAIYFGVDVFYPGGWTGDGTNPGAMQDQSRLIEQNQQVVPNFNLYSDMPGGF